MKCLYLVSLLFYTELLPNFVHSLQCATCKKLSSTDGNGPSQTENGNIRTTHDLSAPKCPEIEFITCDNEDDICMTEIRKTDSSNYWISMGCDKESKFPDFEKRDMCPGSDEKQKSPAITDDDKKETPKTDPEPSSKAPEKVEKKIIQTVEAEKKEEKDESHDATEDAPSHDTPTSPGIDTPPQEDKSDTPAPEPTEKVDAKVTVKADSSSPPKVKFDAKIDKTPDKDPSTEETEPQPVSKRIKRSSAGTVCICSTDFCNRSNQLVTINPFLLLVFSLLATFYVTIC